MKTVRIYPLAHLSPTLCNSLIGAQMEAAQVWNLCVELHKQARMTHGRWPDRKELEQETKGRFALNAQVVQQITHAILANIETTRTSRKEHPQMRMKYPWRTKRYYPVKWPAQAVHREQGRVVLPMGRGRKSLVLPIHLPEHAGACTLAWNHGFELHVCLEIEEAVAPPGAAQATFEATGTASQKAESLYEALLPMEEAATSQEQTLPTSRAAYSRYSPQGHSPGHRLLRSEPGGKALHRQSPRRSRPS